MSIVENPNFKAFMINDIGYPTDHRYEVLPPIANRTYCPITKFSIIDVAYEDINGILI